MLKQRVIFGVLGVVLAVALLTFCNIYIIGSCVAVIALIGLGEFYNVTGIWKKRAPAAFLGFIFSIACFAVALICPEKMGSVILPLIIAFIFLLMISTVFFHERNSFSDSAVSFFGALYICIFFLHIILVRQLEYGKVFIWLILISAWSTDTFAYFAGKTLGRQKLCPKISPKKTVEGAVGGVAGCIIAIIVYSSICAGYIGCTVNYVNAVVFAALTSVVSQLGDLAASCIKREHNVKDYGNLIPGHGGVLDRFDSALLISPLVYYLLIYLPVVVK